MFDTALGAVDIAIGKTVLFEPRTVLFLRHKVESPKIAFILGGRRFIGRIDHAELDPKCIWAGNTGELISRVRDSLIHARHAAVDLRPGAGAVIQVKTGPLHFVGACPKVRCGKVVAGIELEAPLIFSGNVSAGLTAIAELDVVIDLALEHESS